MASAGRCMRPSHASATSIRASTRTMPGGKPSASRARDSRVAGSADRAGSRRTLSSRRSGAKSPSERARSHVDAVGRAHGPARLPGSVDAGAIVEQRLREVAVFLVEATEQELGLGHGLGLVRGRDGREQSDPALVAPRRLGQQVGVGEIEVASRFAGARHPAATRPPARTDRVTAPDQPATAARASARKLPRGRRVVHRGARAQLHTGLATPCQSQLDQAHAVLRRASVAPPMSLRAALALSFAVAASGCSGCHDGPPVRAVHHRHGGLVQRRARGRRPRRRAPRARRWTRAAHSPGRRPWSRHRVWRTGRSTAASLEAPDGRVFVSAIARDFDGDGVNDAFAIVRPPEGNDPGELVFMRARSRAPDGPLAVTHDLRPAPGLARDASCTPVDRLVRVGARAVLVELGAQCTTHPSSAPVRWVAVVAAPAAEGTRQPEGLRLAATVADPVGAPSLTIDADTADRDGDARPDVALRVTIEGGGAPFEPGPRVSGTLAWLDRPAGLSRDASATDASFARSPSAAFAARRSAKEAPAVPATVEQVRALWRAICADGGAPRLVGVAGAGAIRCGAGAPARGAGARGGARLRHARPIRCARCSRSTAPSVPRRRRTPARTTEALELDRAPRSRGHRSRVRAVAAVPLVAKGHEPSWGAARLRAERQAPRPHGRRRRARRSRPGRRGERRWRAAWPPAVTSPDGAMRWIETYDPCDGLPLRATFAPAAATTCTTSRCPCPAARRPLRRIARGPRARAPHRVGPAGPRGHRRGRAPARRARPRRAPLCSPRCSIARGARIAALAGRQVLVVPTRRGTARARARRAAPPSGPRARRRVRASSATAS